MNTTVQALNKLLSLHRSSLPVYLQSARPHVQGRGKAWEVLQHISDDQLLMIDKLAEYVEDQDGTPAGSNFPAEFTGLHDLSVDFILKTTLVRQQNDLVEIEQIAAVLEAGTQAKALTQEALGAAKAHVQSIEECLVGEAV